MATFATIKNEIHVASCANLDTLIAEAQAMVVTSPTMEQWFRDHVFREYNRRKYNYCGAASMFSPYDAGFRPLGSIAVGGSVDNLLLEDGSNLLLEDGSVILLE